MIKEMVSPFLLKEIAWKIEYLKRCGKRILIAAFIYANIFTISILFGMVSHLQDTITALQSLKVLNVEMVKQENKSQKSMKKIKIVVVFCWKLYYSCL